MDWKSIAGVVAPLAPTVGSVLGGLVGGPAGAGIGGIAGRALAEAFGVEATPEAVGKAIAEDPNAATKIQQLENDRGAQIAAQAQVEITKLEQETEQFRIGADDTDHARQFNLALAAAQSPLSWGASILASVFTVAFFVLFAVVLSTPLKENSIIMAFVGTLTAGMIQILSYFFGSSAGSTRNGDRLANLTSQLVDKPNPSPAVVQAITKAAKK